MDLKRKAIIGLKVARVNAKLLFVRISIAAAMIRVAELENAHASPARIKIAREKLNFFRSLEHRRLAEMRQLYGSSDQSPTT
jgi:hypothetical protein